MSITPTPFGSPGGPEDTPDYVTSFSSASGPEGIAEEIDKLGADVLAIENRLVVDEANIAVLVSANAPGTANNPITDSAGTRNSQLTVNYFYCATQPTNWIAGDVWDDTTAA